MKNIHVLGVFLMFCVELSLLEFHASADVRHRDPDRPEGFSLQNFEELETELFLNQWLFPEGTFVNK